MTVILFAGGGSGGHLFPGVAVAEELISQEPSLQCLFAGSDRPLEPLLLKPYGFPHRAIPLPSLAQLYRSPIRTTYSYWRAYSLAVSLFDQSSPAVVVGLGGLSSVPTVLAAYRRNIPVILLEQNAILGRANRFLLRFAKHLCLSFRQTQFPSRYKVLSSVTGNPTRRELLRGYQGRSSVSPEVPTLLILGGSQGARAVNDAVLTMMSRLKPVLSGWRIIHQTGAQDFNRVRLEYQRLGIPAVVSPFLDNLAALYPQTALAISRAGGTTLAELAIHSIPTILIPFPKSIRDHQARNATPYERAGGAIVVRQSLNPDQTANSLTVSLEPLLTQEALRTSMREAMFSLAYPNASRIVAELVIQQLSGEDRPATNRLSIGRTARAS